mgnify:CR=1 FL=1|jgi:hypothetical protein
MSIAIDDERLKNICKSGQGHDTCRYAVYAPGRGFECMKHDPSFGPVLNQRADAGQMNARADNCEGLQ